MTYIDPRGPLVEIVEVLPLRVSLNPRISGTVAPLRLSCGHTVECNPIYVYHFGDRTRCLECKVAK